MSNDQQLLEKAKQLDPDALREFHHRFYEMVARYVQFKVGDQRTVEDLCGEIFVRALEALRRGSAWRDSPQGWIMGIARNVVADHYRQRERMPEVQLNEQVTAAEHTNPLHQAIRSERTRELVQAIRQLTDEQREVIVLRFLEGMDIQSVAQALNKKPGAIKGLQFRAMRALAELIQPQSMEDTV
ncbi:MAG TPA: sigma-70 family RNA polymerase sigma factor [Anaerolineae bacterium]|nr:sigma-70 family RNA polymerase sigma factor [Anaerolineae bacterium]HRV95883.1 sigma-70 family RNA polymerase sigma factor [Anaerolineae bacterium]